MDNGFCFFTSLVLIALIAFFLYMCVSCASRSGPLAELYE